MYNQKAFDILNSSINSAVFIDEKAKDFFSGSPINTEIVEEKLSLNLFKTFKENGKSLVVHKFQKTDIDDEKVLEYLFNGRDLILLDWELDDIAGQEHSLKLLSRAIQLPYINFCCIYSRSQNFNEIPFFLYAFFSGLHPDDLKIVRERYSYIEVEDLLKLQGRTDNDHEIFFKENEIEFTNFPIERCRSKSYSEIVDILLLSLQEERYIFPEEPFVDFKVVVSADKQSFIINNTLIFLLKKNEETDSDFPRLIRRISEEVVKNKSSFFQLLGMEMQSIFNRNERFIDDTILKSSTEALFSFRNHLNNDKTFGIIIKKLLLEQATLKLRTAKLQLLESEFLDVHGKTLNTEIKTADLMHLNTFYNSVTVKGLSIDAVPDLNFGDVFVDDEENYYLCVTALCDCYYPSKIDFNFYFVKGSKFLDVELALLLGDTAFISFLPDGVAVYWGNLDDPKIKKVTNYTTSKSDEVGKLKTDVQMLQNNILKLQTNQERLSSFLYKPFYIKPKVFNVENNKLKDGKLRIWDITNRYHKEKFNQDLNYFNVTYVTTLRNDYTQRIANHAFGHPARVGVDFIKK